MADQFKSARDLLAWGQADVRQIVEQWSKHARSIPSNIRWDEGGLGYDLIVEIDPNVSEDILKLGHNAANAFKHGCDQMMHAAVLVADPSWKGKLAYFPWGASEADTDGRLARFPLPHEACAIIKQCRPWQGGDEQLRDFATFANSNKHQITMKPMPALDLEGIEFPFKEGEVLDGIKIEIPVASEKFPRGPIERSPGSFLVATCTKRLDVGIKLINDLYVEAKGALSNAPIVPIIANCLTTAQKVCNDLDAWAERWHLDQSQKT